LRDWRARELDESLATVRDRLLHIKYSMSSKIGYLAYGTFEDSFGLPWYRAMEQALATFQLPCVVSPSSARERLIGKVLARLRLVRPCFRSRQRAFLVPIMHIQEYRFFPRAYWSELIPICFDCWPGRWHEWEAMFRRQRVKLAFFTARDAMREFARRIPTMNCQWLPEATDPTTWIATKPIAERKIDVLELGRKHDSWHSQVTTGLRDAGKVHLYEAAPGKIVFASRAELIDGYANAKVSVCFPQSETHPERAAGVETATMRYFESMASKCLVVGKCPQELADDFGYNPVIEVDMQQPLLQLESILNHLPAYQPLIERNYQMVLEKANWQSRFRQALEIVNDHQANVLKAKAA
jgi:hypothetical protein